MNEEEAMLLSFNYTYVDINELDETTKAAVVQQFPSLKETPLYLIGRDVYKRQSELNWILAGSDDEANNKGTYFLGFSTINGRGEIPYNAATGQWEFLYGASTCNPGNTCPYYLSLIHI